MTKIKVSIVCAASWGYAITYACTKGLFASPNPVLEVLAAVALAAAFITSCLLVAMWTISRELKSR